MRDWFWLHLFRCVLDIEYFLLALDLSKSLDEKKNWILLLSFSMKRRTHFLKEYFWESKQRWRTFKFCHFVNCWHFFCWHSIYALYPWYSFGSLSFSMTYNKILYIIKIYISRSHSAKEIYTFSRYNWAYLKHLFKPFHVMYHHRRR